MEIDTTQHTMMKKVAQLEDLVRDRGKMYSIIEHMLQCAVELLESENKIMTSVLTKIIKEMTDVEEIKKVLAQYLQDSGERFMREMYGVDETFQKYH